MKRLWLLVCFLTVLVIAEPAFGQAWVFSRFPGAAPVIDLDKDEISLMVMDARVSRNRSFLKQGASVGFVISAELRGQIADSDEKSVRFPLAYEAPFQTRDENGDLPFQEYILLRVPLSRNVAQCPGETKMLTYRGFSFEVALASKDEPTFWGKVVKTLISKTKGFTLPTNPFGVALGYARDFADDLISSQLPTDGKDAPAVRKGKAAFVLLPPGALNPHELRAGMYLLLEQRPNSTPAWVGWVDTDHHANYCFYTQDANGSPVFKVAPKSAAGEPSDYDGCDPAKYVDLKNNRIPFLLLANQKRARYYYAGPPPDPKMEASTELCKLYGVRQCLPRRKE